MMDSKGKTKRIDSSQYSLFSLFFVHTYVYTSYINEISRFITNRDISMSYYFRSFTLSL